MKSDDSGDSLLKRNNSKEEREQREVLVNECDSAIKKMTFDLDENILKYLRESSYERIVRHLIVAKLELNDYNLSNFCQSMRVTRDTGVRMLSKFGITVNILNAKKVVLKKLKKNGEIV